jgi:hypothetical protein
MRSTPLILRFGANKQGYLTVCLVRHDGKKKTRFVHHVVLESFRGDRPVGTEARHVHDHTPTNNTLSNLEWGTKAQNAQDRDRHGRTAKGTRQGTHTKPESRLYGEQSGVAVYTDEQIRDVARRLAEGERATSIALATGINRHTVFRVKWGQRHVA